MVIVTAMFPLVVTAEPPSTPWKLAEVMLADWMTLALAPLLPFRRFLEPNCDWLAMRLMEATIESSCDWLACLALLSSDASPLATESDRAL